MTSLVGPFFLLFIFSAIPYVLATAMPNWRWLLGLTAVTMSMLAAGLSRRWIIGNVGACGGFGLLMLVVGGAGLAVGVVICGLTLLMRARGIAQGRIDMLHAFGTLIAPAMLLLTFSILALPIWR